MVKIVVVAPIPSPRVRMATAANPGLRRSVRQAYATSCINVCMALYTKEGVEFIVIDGPRL
jgi:hypothetical protein